MVGVAMGVREVILARQGELRQDVPADWVLSLADWDQGERYELACAGTREDVKAWAEAVCRGANPGRGDWYWEPRQECPDHEYLYHMDLIFGRISVSCHADIGPVEKEAVL